MNTSIPPANRRLAAGLILGATGSFLAAPVLQAAVFLDAVTFGLAPNTPNQQIQIPFRSDSSFAVSGLDFNFQVGDGGPELGGTDGPSVTGVDLFTGTVFAGLDPNVTHVINLPQLQVFAVDLNADTTMPVSGNPRLATVTIDTTGFSTIGQSWVLGIADSLNGSSAFLDSTASSVGFTVVGGDLQITIVPEPQAYTFFAGVGLLGFLAWRGFATRRA